MVNKLSEKSKGIVGVFSGDDQSGYRYIIGSRCADLRKYANVINSGLLGKGGGSASMIQGRSSSGSKKIREFINALKLN